MRCRLLSIAATATLVVGLTASSVSAVGERRGPNLVPRGKAATVPTAPGGLQLLYDQNDNDAGVGIPSQDFTDPGFDIYDAQGAVDFKVPAGQTWLVQQLVVTGTYLGTGPADYETVVIYRSSGPGPGAPIHRFSGLHGADSFGSFTITLPGGGVGLQAGTYWVSVAATMEYARGGEWNWETRTVNGGGPAAWRNPQDGFETGCTTYARMIRCVGPYGEGPELMFALYGTST